MKEAKGIGIGAVLQRGTVPLQRGEGLKGYSEKDGDFAWVEVRGARDLDRAVESSLRKDFKFVVVDCTNWKIIPLENLIGEFRRRHRKVYADPAASYGILMDRLHSIEIESAADLAYASYVIEHGMLDASPWRIRT